MINQQLQLDGAKWRNSHQSSVDAILASTGLRRTVASYGERFYNVDAWPGRAMLAAIAASPDAGYIDWLERANQPGPKPRIVIASTPDELPHGLAMALVGGAYHEAWHTLYTRRRPISLEQVEHDLGARVKQGDSAFWAASGQAMMEWSNIIEDIRIERIGCKAFPGTGPKMVALQDLILKMEMESRPEIMPELTPTHILSFIACLFRDLGLGYNSPSQRAALLVYDRICPEARQIVDGPLRPFLDAAINLGPQDDLACGWLAMDILLALRGLGKDAKGESGEGESGEGESGEGKPGKGESGEGKPGKGKPGKGGSGKGESGEGKPGKGKPGEGESGKGKPGEGESGKGESGEGESGEGESGKGKPGKGESGEGESGEGESGEGESGEGESGEGESGEGESIFNQQGQVGSKGGGHSVLNDQQIRELAASLIAALTQGLGVIDGSKALEGAITAHIKRDLGLGEKPWRPAYPEGDRVRVSPKQDHSGGLKIRNQVRKEIATLRSRLRSKFLAARTVTHTHGVRKGLGLSERRIVDSVIEIQSGIIPKRPDFQRDLKNDCSLAVALIIDESGSMHGLRKDTVRAAVAIADSLASLDCPILVAGPRNYSNYTYQECDDNLNDCHRTGAVQIDIFKDWNESMAIALSRFTGISANGGTPLEDGIQYALQSLNKRRERHRVVLVITDGCPDNSDVVRHQIRVAQGAQIDIVGVGIGYGCHHVEKLFPQHVVVEDLPSLPKALAVCLEGLVFPAQAKNIKLTEGFKSRLA